MFWVQISQMNVFYSVPELEDSLFYKSLSLLWSIFCIGMLLFSSKEDLGGDVRVPRYLRNSRTMVMPKFQNKSAIIILVQFSYIILYFDCMCFLPLSFWLFTCLSGCTFFAISNNRILSKDYYFYSKYFLLSEILWNENKITERLAPKMMITQVL